MQLARTRKPTVSKGPRTRTVMRENPYGNGWEPMQLGIDIDPLEHMAERRFISMAQKRAGDKFKAAYEAVSGQRGLAIDYTVERVDSSGTGQAVSQQAVDGMAVLNSARAALGKQDYPIVIAVAGWGMTVAAYANLLAKGSVRTASRDKEAREYVGKRFRDALTTLAIEWGYERSGTAKHRLVGSSEALKQPHSGPVSNVAAWVHPQNRPRD